MLEPELKAAGLVSYIAAMRKVVGDAPFERFLTKLSPSLQALINHPPLATVWIPSRELLESAPFAVDELFGGNVERLVEVGREQIRRDLGGIYKIFVRVASPRFVAERAAVVYTTYMRNNGSARLSASGDRFIELTFSDVQTPSEAFYALRRGNMLGAMDATGVKGCRVQVISGGGNLPSCTIRASFT